MSEMILSVDHITKRYPGVVAVNDFSLSFEKGEVHGLIGENGSGKSTLIKSISGAVTPESGTFTFEGETYEHMNPKLSRSLGIEVIYQELNLIGGLTVAENVCFGEETGKIVDYKKLRAKAQNIFSFMNVNVNPDALVMDLPVAQQQLVEIAKAISKDAKMIIMDEPTAPLTVSEVDSLFEIIEKLKKRGTTIIYISHRMEELFIVTDRVTVMRDGLFINTLKTSETNRGELISLMVGRELKEEYPQRSNISTDKVLELRGVTGNGNTDISFSVCKGEIVGMAGLVGAGRTELARVIFGANKLESGEIYIHGKKVTIKSPDQAIGHGIGLIPEDRKRQGCFLASGISWNISISNIRKLSRYGFVNDKLATQQAEKYRDLMRIKTPSLNQLVMNLSGGNQQKVVIAKVLATNSDLIIFDEPTRGIDVGAKQEIYNLMTQLADEGKAILMISSDMEELLGMSDRIVVLSEGRLVGEVPRPEFSQTHILELASS